MTPALFFAWMIVGFGFTAGLLFLSASLSRPGHWSWRVLCLGTAVICWYCAVLWGGQQLRLWLISPEFGRPALGLTLAALTWFGLLISQAGRKNDS